MSLRIIEPGLHSRIVDAGRPHSRGLGVPIGGAADRAAWRLGNALLGNPVDVPALEITLLGPTLLAEQPVGLVVYGAAFSLQVDGQVFLAGQPFRLGAGHTLKIGGTQRGTRGYLCVTGGFKAPWRLGSRSSLEPLLSGVVLDCGNDSVPSHRLPSILASDLLQPEVPSKLFRVISGPQADWFPANWINQIYRVTTDSDRMGIRLHGTPLARTGSQMISEPVVTGTIQVTNEGQCIILGVDGQTIGGYPKIAHVIQADRDRLAQCSPGDRLTFSTVSREHAAEQARERRRREAIWLLRLQNAERASVA